MKRAIKSFLGIKSKSEKDKDHTSENTTASTANSTLNSADPHRRSSNSNQPCVILHEATSAPHGPQPTRNIIEVQRRLRASTTGESSIDWQPRPQSEIAHNNRTRTRSPTVATTIPPPEQTEIQDARRLYFHQPQLINRGAGIGGLASDTHKPFEGNPSNKSSQVHIAPTRAAAIDAATQAVYEKNPPCQIYHCVACSSPPHSNPPLAQGRGYGTDPRQEAGPDDYDNPLSTRNSSDDSYNQTLKRKTQLCDLGSLQSAPSNAVHANSNSEDRREMFGGKVEMGNKEEEEMDSPGVYIKTTSFQHQHNLHRGHQDHEQDQAEGQGQTQGSSKAPQYRSPDLERALSPVPDSDPAPNPTSHGDSKKRFSLSSLASRAIFYKRSETSSSKGKGTNRGNTQSDISDKVSPKVRQFDLDVDQFMRDNTILGLEKHPYRVGLEYELQLQALAYATNLAKARETDQVEATILQQSQEGTNITLKDPVSAVLQEPVLVTSQPRPLSIQPKGLPSIPIVSISDSPPSRTTDTSESKRLSNTSRGTSHRSAHRIIYGAELENGLPKGHIVREGNYEIVPTKRFSASSAKTNNTSSRSYTITHVRTTVDNMDGVPGGPAPAAVTLIIRPENRGKSHRIITTATTAGAANKQEFSNTFGRSSVIGSINSGGLSESEGHGSEQFMPTRMRSILGGETKQADFGTTKKRAEGRETGLEHALVEFLSELSDIVLPEPGAESCIMQGIREGEARVEYCGDSERQLRMAKRPTVVPRHVTGQHTLADPRHIMSSWIEPARLRSLDMVLSRINWLPTDLPLCNDASDLEQSRSTPPIAPTQGQEGETGQKDAPYTLDDHSISNSISTESTDDLALGSAIIAGTAPSSSIAQSSNRAVVLINGLTAEELINSVRFESDCEGSLGFYGPREFERDQKRRRKEAHEKKEQEKAAAKAAMDGTQGVGASSTKRIMEIVSTFWPQMTQNTIIKTTSSAMTTN